MLRLWPHHLRRQRLSLLQGLSAPLFLLLEPLQVGFLLSGLLLRQQSQVGLFLQTCLWAKKNGCVYAQWVGSSAWHESSFVLLKMDEMRPSFKYYLHHVRRYNPQHCFYWNVLSHPHRWITHWPLVHTLPLRCTYRASGPGTGWGRQAAFPPPRRVPPPENFPDVSSDIQSPSLLSSSILTSTSDVSAPSQTWCEYCCVSTGTCLMHPHVTVQTPILTPHQGQNLSWQSLTWYSELLLIGSETKDMIEAQL